MELLFLGTGAAQPTPSRRSSATALIRKGEILLFDCGEGTQIQFQKAQLKPGKLKHIFISHLHGDHFYGLIGFLTSLQLAGRETPLFIYGPKGLSQYLCFMQQLSQMTFGYPLQVLEIAENQEAEWDLGEYVVRGVELEHRIFCLGFRVEEKPRPGKFDVGKAQSLGISEGDLRTRLQNGETIALSNGRQITPEDVMGPERPGKTVAFCLDTRPCRSCIELARNADLLVHEATFDQSHKNNAAETYHSTIAQAAEVAKAAGAKQLVLTHISARYEKIKETKLLAQATKIFPNTTLGHDLMRVPI